jgi:hypothetical protein
MLAKALHSLVETLHIGLGANGFDLLSACHNFELRKMLPDDVQLSVVGPHEFQGIHIFELYNDFAQVLKTMIIDELLN